MHQGMLLSNEQWGTLTFLVYEPDGCPWNAGIIQQGSDTIFLCIPTCLQCAEEEQWIMFVMQLVYDYI